MVSRREFNKAAPDNVARAVGTLAAAYLPTEVDFAVTAL